MSLNAEWRIRACSHQCHACEKPFEDGEKVFTRLMFAQGEAGYVREDYCPACARKLGPEAKQEALSHWVAQYAAPDRKPDPLKKETAESLLRTLMEQEDPAKTAIIYILAVMLERRRILVEREVQLQPDGGKIRVYAHKQTGEIFIVSDPDLKLTELEDVQTQVLALLSGEAAAAAPAEPPAETPAPAAEDEVAPV